MSDHRDEVIANLRAENRALWETRMQQGVPQVTTVFGYTLDKILDLIEEHEEHQRMLYAPRATVDEIVKRTCEELGVQPEAIYSTCRTREVSRARHLAMRRVYDLGPEWSMPRIGRHFKRDHTTVLHALRRYPKGS